MKATFSLFFLFMMTSLVSSAQVELAKTFDQNGLLTAVWFELSPDEVQVIRFYPSGQLQEVGSWYQGRMHGSWAMWAENGHKLGEAHYQYGRKTGRWKLWSPAGEWQYDLWYDKDQLVDARMPSER